MKHLSLSLTALLALTFLSACASQTTVATEPVASAPVESSTPAPAPSPEPEQIAKKSTTTPQKPAVQVTTKTKTTTSTTTTAPTPKVTTPVPVAPQNKSALIQGFAFSPATITVKKGATVTWTNQDSVGHTVTADGGSFGSALLAKGQSFSFTFNTVGSFGYFCKPHPNMRGTVVVTE